MHYVNRHAYVDAVKWDGESEPEGWVKLCSAGFKMFLRVREKPSEHPWTARPGDYLITFPDGGVKAMAPEEFVGAYMKAPDHGVRSEAASEPGAFIRHFEAMASEEADTEKENRELLDALNEKIVTLRKGLSNLVVDVSNMRRGLEGMQEQIIMLTQQVARKADVAIFRGPGAPAVTDRRRTGG